MKDSLTKEERLGIAAECYADPVLFCKTFLSHWFPKEIPWVHRGIFAIILRKTDFLIKYGDLAKIEKHFVTKLDPQDEHSATMPIFNLVKGENGEILRIDLNVKKYTLIQMPRGFSKTTIANACSLYEIMYQDLDVSLYVSETGGHSKRQLGNVKKELEDNKYLELVFGRKVPNRQDSEKWTEEMITTTDGISLVARGRGGQVRGLNIFGRRPKRVVVDDLEDSESVSTEEQIKKTVVWFYGDLKPVMSKLDADASMIILGTCRGKDTLLETLKKDLEFTTIVFSAIDLDGEPLWAENMDLEKLEAEKASYALAGRLREFYMEYMSKITDETTAKFRSSFFMYASSPKLVGKAICLDPAISKSRQADDATIGVVGMGENGKIHVCDLWGKKGAEPKELVDMYFEMVCRHNPDKHGVESIGYQAALIYLLREEMYRRGRYFEIIPIGGHKEKKTTRILGILQPRYAAGYITHERRFPKLEQQLLEFGTGHDDYPDVIAMAIALLDPYAAQAADPEVDLGADQYEPISEMEYAHAP